ncbi:MAG: DUF456 domain-containing protein [Prevotellaceae bacterium]|jgi:uncharacterized protein YqgC (DUF456 family)|nr:DUF456 domain-containing protein [Prevotellaceae bacterium]
MEVVLIIIGCILLTLGFIGCFAPALPGPPLAFAAILIRHLASNEITDSTTTLIVLGVFVVLVSILDYTIPMWFTRISGGSKYGSKGALIGMIAGIFLTPVGMLLGMYLGALIGELIHDSSNFGKAFLVACYSFIGFLLTVGIKFIYCVVAVYYFFFP